MEEFLKENKNHKNATLTGHDFEQKKKHKGYMESQWSHLPHDILRLLISNMSLVEQIRFFSVCKTWKLPVNCIRPVDKLPWMMLYKWTISRSVCKLYDPSQKKFYVIEDGYKLIDYGDKLVDYGYETEEIDEDGYKPDERSKLVGASVCASKYGWVLCSVKTNTNKASTLFVYSPFRKEVIELPELGIGFKKATFSSTPTSPDCLFLVVFEFCSKILINTCQRGDRTWKTFYVDGLFGPVHDIAYTEGSFYCLFSKGDLGVFNVALQEWRLLNTVTPLIDNYRGPPCNYSLIVSDGQLLTSCSEQLYKRPQVFRFDMKQKDWVKEERLRNQALFVDPSSTSFSLSAVDEEIEYADTVTYKDGFPYSLKTSSFQTAMDFWNKAKPTVREGLERVWIEPPQMGSLYFG